MKKAPVIIIAGLIVIVLFIGLYFLPVSHLINTTTDGYIIYRSGSELNVSVTITGKHRDHLFYNGNGRDVFDGTIYVNGNKIGVGNDTIVIDKEAGNTFYKSSSADKNGSVTVRRFGDELINKRCDTVVISCCYDSLNNTDTADETYRCLVVAPAKNLNDARNILASNDYAENLKHFHTWRFE